MAARGPWHQAPPEADTPIVVETGPRVDWFVDWYDLPPVPSLYYTEELDSRGPRPGLFLWVAGEPYQLPGGRFRFFGPIPGALGLPSQAVWS